MWVAPHAGAWIETKVSSQSITVSEVAPHAGAWIETVYDKPMAALELGRAPRGRVD